MSIGIGNYEFNHVHFSDACGGHCAEIEKWYDYDNGVEVKTKEFGAIFLSEGTYMLFKDDCPYCS